jgi:hypothetical protein
VAAKTALNATNLEALGAGRLATLLIEISAGNAAAKRRLRLALATAHSPGEAAKEVRKRLTILARSRSFVGRQDIRSVADDLDTQRRAIIAVAEADPAMALDLLWRLMALAPSVFDRCDDSSGVVSGIFNQACHDIGDIALRAGAAPITLAEQVFDALVANDYGQFDGLIGILAPALGQEGLEYLKQCTIAFAKRAHAAIGRSPSGPVSASAAPQHPRAGMVRLALTEIADAQGDVDGFIEQYDDETRKAPKIAAAIARRLLAAGRAPEAWQAIETTEHRRRNEVWDWPDFEWEDARIEVLDALGRTDDAQAARWDCFERSLSSAHLRAYLKRLPDFDDVAAEKKALDHAQRSPNLLQALSFLVSWPALNRAAALVLERSNELDGDRYEILTRTAEALAAKHPLAATLALRAMVDFALTNGRSSRYRHAARHLLDCASLSSAIEDFGSFESHEIYQAGLRRRHGRKIGFWSCID